MEKMVNKHGFCLPGAFCLLVGEGIRQASNAWVDIYLITNGGKHLGRKEEDVQKRIMEAGGNRT